jgi:hypothetical protein
MFAKALGRTLPVVIVRLAAGCAASLIAAVICLAHHAPATAGTEVAAATGTVANSGPPWTGPLSNTSNLLN